MKIVTYLDNDELNQPNTGDAAVYTLNVSSPVNKDQLIKKHPKVFNEESVGWKACTTSDLIRRLILCSTPQDAFQSRYENVSRKPWMA